MELIKKILFVICGFAITTLSADCNRCDPDPCECPPEPSCCDVPAAPTTAAYNKGANIDVCGSWDFYVTGTFLYWQIRQQQMDVAYTSFGIPPASITGIGIVHEFSFDWKPAFKVGIGYAWDYDNWDTYVQYTRINTNMTDSFAITAPGESLYPGWGTTQPETFPTLIPNQVQGEWSLNHNIIDLEFGRPYYNGTSLIFKAHYGLRGGWIDQSYDQTITDLSSQAITSSLKSDSWLIGPRTGIYTNWTFGEGFRFFGNAAASLFYQKFTKVNYREPYLSNPAQQWQAFDYSAEAINASIDMLLGLGWGTYFDRNNWHFDLFAGYEAQIFFNQNMMRYLHQEIVLLDFTQSGNLMFHGLNVTAQFDF